MPINENVFNIQAELDQAIQYHQAGRFQLAEGIYKHILGIQPNHPDALHLLGLIAHHRGDDDRALDLIQKAIQHDPQTAFYHCSLGDVFSSQGNLIEAVLRYQQAIRLKPDLAEAHFNMGNAYHADDRLDEAITSYQKALLKAKASLTRPSHIIKNCWK
jgi:tetratricopeptide (TPR) repeat protein